MSNNTDKNIKEIRLPYSEFRRLVDKLNDIENKLSTTQELLTPKQVCKLLDVSRTTFETYKNEGLFPCYNLKGRVFVMRQELMKAISNHPLKVNK